MPSRRVITIYENLNNGAEFKENFALGFEPDEVRLLQHGISNDQKANMIGVVVCNEIKDFNLVVCCSASSATTSINNISCRNNGPISSLTFRFCLTGIDSAEVAQDARLYMVIEFIKH